MDLEQIVKYLQAQNTQFQQFLITLAKGQEELKTLLVEERKEKTKKVTGVLNMGRRFHGQTRRTLDFATTSGERNNQDGKGKETIVPSEEEKEEEDYSEEHTLQLITNINVSKSG